MDKLKPAVLFVCSTLFVSINLYGVERLNLIYNILKLYEYMNIFALRMIEQVMYDLSYM